MHSKLPDNYNWISSPFKSISKFRRPSKAPQDAHQPPSTPAIARRSSLHKDHTASKKNGKIGDQRQEHQETIQAELGSQTHGASSTHYNYFVVERLPLCSSRHGCYAFLHLGSLVGIICSPRRASASDPCRAKDYSSFAYAMASWTYASMAVVWPGAKPAILRVSFGSS